MSKQPLYHAMLTIYENNFRVLHWKLGGNKFHTTHDRFAKYYEQLGEFMDETSEILMTCGEQPTNFKSAYDMLVNSEDTYNIVSAEVNYDSNTANSIAASMFDQLYELAEDLEDDDDLPADVRDVYMKHLGYYRIEGKYKLGRANCNVSNSSDY